MKILMEEHNANIDEKIKIALLTSMLPSGIQDYVFQQADKDDFEENTEKREKKKTERKKQNMLECAVHFLCVVVVSGHPQPSHRDGHPCIVDVLPGPTGVI